MDPASMSASVQSLSDDSLPPMAQPLPSPPHHRRHIRYATPETSAPPQPHFILETTSNNHRAASHSHRASRTMSASPPVTASSSQANHQGNATYASEVEGQDHDRMETDEENEENDESEGSDSDAGEDTPEPESREPETEVAAPAASDNEMMDTSPDAPLVQEDPPQDPPAQASVGVIFNEATGEATSLRLVHVQVPPVNPAAPDGAQTGPVPDLRTASGESRLARLRAAERELVEMGDTRRAERLRTERLRREAAGEDGEGDDDSDESADEEEHPYWVNLKEDTSVPDERELRVIEENGDEVSALDYDHWEKLVYQPLDDPEYVPGESGRICWTVKGVHGTAEKPNREKIMRSPSVLIGEYYWNIKYFPHGNDGTEQLSIYVECSPTPYEEAEADCKKAVATDVAPERSEDLIAIESLGETATENTVTAETSALPNGVDESSTPAARDEEMEATLIPPKKSDPKSQELWGVAAQISCVIYNPDEPRVNASQTGCHRYYNDNPDWGWTRFHGPWDEIHKRQRFQRQALLRNDTLAFTAYIRTVKDDTNALWWHSPKDRIEWDSAAMTGVRAFECQEYQSSAMIAALSSWMQLSPFEELVSKVGIPDPVWEPYSRMRPAFEELQEIFEEVRSPTPSEERDISLSGLVSILNHYGADLDSKMDVVMIWETLRRILNFEASGHDTIEEGNSPVCDLFKENILLLKQPDLLNNANPNTKYPRLSQEGRAFPSTLEPHSVQETLDKATSDDSAAFRTWQSFEGQYQTPPHHPFVLQIELHRQSYFKEARKWKKLTHRVEIDEKIVLNGSDYTLYGMIVHSGDLESKDYSSVIRPEGPGTRWIKYAGDSHERKVTVLTSKQAIKAHEGTGDNADGTAAVAYVVLYVRTEFLPEVLRNPLKQGTTELPSRDTQALTAPQGDEMTDSKEPEQNMPVFIYGADSFEGFSGRGLCDPWVFTKRGHFVKKLSFPTSTTISKVGEKLSSGLFTIEKPETTEIRVWPMNTTAPSVRAYPGLLSYKAHCEDTLDEMGQHSGGCRFWMTIADKAPILVPEPVAPEAISEADQAREQAARDAALQAVMLSIPAADNQAPSEAPGWAEAGDTEMAGAGGAPQETERQRQRRQQQLLLQMQQAQQQQQQLAAQEAQQRQLEVERNAQQLKETYFLVKVFDAETQTLRGMGSAVVKSESKIVEEAKSVLKIEGTESWDCYHERGFEIEPKDLVKAHETFETRCGGADGSIFIVQRRPTAIKIASLEAEGKSTTPIEYFFYLHGLDNPSYLRDHFTSSYFGSNYKSWSLKNGVPHGQGTLITLAGDAYEGTFVAGVKSGHGTMAYASGDTYIGEWKSGDPNGQGQMVYAKTGNVYTGGFKKRKRHGKGTMSFEVADEEMQLCKICYEGEMDALFYDCGHVVACEECARQVEVCPVCRKNVRAVVKIWRT